MRKTMQRILSLIMAFAMLAALFTKDLFHVNAEDTRTDSADDSVLSEETKITDQSTWHVLEERDLSELIHDDYALLLRDEAVKRTGKIPFTLSRLSSYTVAVPYLISKSIEHTGKPKEGDSLRWQMDSISYSVSDHVYTGYQLYELSPEYYTTAQQEERLDEEVSSFIDFNEIRNKTDYRKIKAVYDWMYTYLSLIETTDDTAYKTAYSAQVDKRADSQGFALLFYRLMLEMGVDCRVIHGRTPDYSSWFWNIVKLGDLYYYIDPAMAAVSGNLAGWFLNGSSEFIGHTPDDEYRTLAFSLEYEMARTSFVPDEEDLIETDVCQGAFFDQRTIKIDENGTFKLYASVLPSTYSQGVFWTSSDTSIVSVDQWGNVTGNAEGSAYVYAKPEAGGKMARCKVTVEKVYPDSGMAYAVMVSTDEDTNWGDLIFLRSKNNYEPETYGEIVDIWGNRYTGVVVAKGATIEGARCDYNSTRRPWSGLSHAVLRIYAAENQIIHLQQMNGWFFTMDNLREFYGNGFDLSHCTAGTQVFGYCKKLVKADFTGMETKGLKTFSTWFQQCTSLKELDLSPLDTSEMTSMASMLEFCTSLERVDLSSFDTSKILSMKRAFFGCSKLKEVVLGPGFTVWQEEAYLPAGSWTNGIITKTETELYDEYPANAAVWAGTWRKVEEVIHVTDVVVTPSELTLEEGSSSTLRAQAVPMNAENRDIAWSSDNPSVASVDQSGKVTALKAGSARIIAKSEDSGVEGYCNVTVTAPPVPQPSSIRLNLYNATIAAGAEVQLTASVLPAAADQTLTWKSGNEQIASVDQNGNVKGLRAGSAFITATAVNGITAGCDIRVEFDDVSKSSQFFYEPVYWAAENGITTGTSAVTFSPNEKVTRGQIVTFLYRAAGQPEVTGTSPFTDVKPSSFFYKAVLWASNNKITTGTSETQFSPNEYCTRGQIVTFLWRFANQPPAKTKPDFIDVKDSAFYAKAVAWAAENNITTGTSTSTFSPNETCTRGQAVTFLYRAVH